MAKTTSDPQILPERLISWTIGATWWLWLLGGLYVVGPALAWILAALAVGRWYFRAGEDQTEILPIAIWCWLIGMGAMLVILCLGHLNAGLGAGQTIKSAVGWAKGWALLALFPWAGFMLPIRATVVYRAICKLGRQTLLVMPLFVAAPFVGLPQTLWTSPLKILGGGNDEFFAAILYTLEPGSGVPRWQFFAPWSPAAGIVAVIHMLCAIEERDLRWKITGNVAAILMALLSQSRMALVAVAVIWPLTLLGANFRRPANWLTAAPVVASAGWFAPRLMAFADRMQSDFAGARADSSRVRATLGRIAVERWQNEAYWFGHGVVERGPHLVEYMPIGSHHSWYGLLFVKGITGAIALAVPLSVSLVQCLLSAARARTGRIGLSMVLTYLLYSFGENLEVLSYICWPALLLIGISLRSAKSSDSGDGFVGDIATGPAQTGGTPV